MNEASIFDTGALESASQNEDLAERKVDEMEAKEIEATDLEGNRYI